MLRSFVLATIATVAVQSVNADTVVNFEELTLFNGTPPSGSGEYFNGYGEGADTDGFISQGVEFQTRQYGPGFSYSNVNNSETAGFMNQFAAYPGGGSDGTGATAKGTNYGMANGNATLNLPTGALVQSIDWTNSTYAYLSMENGDSFAKEFGGPTGNDADYFRAILTGYSETGGVGSQTGSVTLTLADFTFSDNSMDYIVDSWQVNEDLTGLGIARSIGLSFESSDVGMFGINTPKYLAFDNLTYVTAIPEPSLAGLMMLVGGVVACRRNRRR